MAGFTRRRCVVCEYVIARLQCTAGLEFLSSYFALILTLLCCGCFELCHDLERFQLSVERFFVTVLCDWFKKLAPPTQPIRLKKN